MNVFIHLFEASAGRKASLLASAIHPRSLCGEDEWPKLNVCGGGRILVQQNTLVSVRQCPVRCAVGMARRTFLLPTSEPSNKVCLHAFFRNKHRKKVFRVPQVRKAGLVEKDYSLEASAVSVSSSLPFFSTSIDEISAATTSTFSSITSCASAMVSSGSTASSMPAGRMMSFA